MLVAINRDVEDASAKAFVFHFLGQIMSDEVEELAHAGILEQSESAEQTGKLIAEADMSKLDDGRDCRGRDDEKGSDGRSGIESFHHNGSSLLGA